jgi:hypothetical protein
VPIAKEKGVLLSTISPRAIRMVTHLDVTGPRFGDAVRATVAAFREVTVG